MRSQAVVACAALIVSGASLWAQQPVREKVKRLAREYLETTDAAKRAELARELDAFDCDPESVVLSLKPKPPAKFEAGYFEKQCFRTPELLAKYPDARLYYIVPEFYRPGKAIGLIVMMHGGGADPLDRTQTAPARYLHPSPKGPGLGVPFRESGMITVAPCALFKEGNSSRWCRIDTDDYIRDVIAEFENHYNIDPNRVALAGYSMGGYGAFHQIQRQPDRFSVVLAGAGGWRLAWWPVIRGTPLWIVHGEKDANWPVRKMHTTDVAYARLAHKILAEHGIDHEYREHPGGHDRKDAFQALSEFIARMKDMKRDAYYPHVVNVSRRGWTSNDRFPAEHNRWLTILEDDKKAKLPYDSVKGVSPPKDQKMSDEERFRAWKAELSKLERPGAVVEAVNRGKNRFEVTTQNIHRFALWLHPKMVDFAKPIRVTVNGKEVFNERVKPSISAALRSYERRRDWGLIYTAEIQLDAREQAK